MAGKGTFRCPDCPNCPPPGGARWDFSDIISAVGGALAAIALSFARRIWTVAGPRLAQAPGLLSRWSRQTNLSIPAPPIATPGPTETITIESEDDSPRFEITPHITRPRAPARPRTPPRRSRSLSRSSSSSVEILAIFEIEEVASEEEIEQPTAPPMEQAAGPAVKRKRAQPAPADGDADQDSSGSDSRSKRARPTPPEGATPEQSAQEEPVEPKEGKQPKKGKGKRKKK